MAAEEDSPLIKALPPASDYLTYLTIVEYNLTPENLPILHKVLQDEKLTTNIGWDLVHLLVPHLPDSEQCLRDIARLGNPREVILKVTEGLRLIAYEDESEDDDQDTEALEGDVRSRPESSTYPLRTARTQDSIGSSEEVQAVEKPPPLPLPVNQFVALLSMLAILHPRIKTMYPSRFLSTTLMAILVSFSKAHEHREEMVLAIVKTVKAVAGIQRPSLPARKSSGMLWSDIKRAAKAAADPEAPEHVELGEGEISLQKRLVQAFVTHVVEEYMLHLTSYDDVPGMAWCSRIMEKLHPDRNVPGTTTLASRFANEETLNRRIDAVGQLLNLARDLDITDEQLLAGGKVVEDAPIRDDDEESLPASADEIPLSKLGSILLYATRQVSSVLYDGIEPRGPVFIHGTSFNVFPDHQTLLKMCLASPDVETGNIGTGPEALIDSVLAMGLVCLERDSIGEPTTEEDFNGYLQTSALLSSNCPSSNLRGHAHYLTSTVLRSQPDDRERLAFIRDTLENCPFENLRVSAVGWIKGETIEANPASSNTESETETDAKSIFASPQALDSLTPFLFPSLQAEIVTAPLQDAWTTFQTNLSFYLASLNFLYLLLTATHLRQNLDIPELWSNADVAGSFLQPLRDARARFAKELNQGGLSGEKSDAVDAELALLDQTIARVTDAVHHLNDA